MKKTIQLFTTTLVACTLFAACGENKDPNANAAVPDTTIIDTMNNIPPAGSMPGDSIATDSMKGTRGNSADTSKPAL